MTLKIKKNDYTLTRMTRTLHKEVCKGKGKAIPLQARCGPEGG